MLTVQPMEPHCSCHVRAASYLLGDVDVVVLFVSATADLCHARLLDGMNRVMELAKRFEEATAYASVSLTSLEPHELYPISRAKRISTKYGATLVLTLRISETSIVQVFLPTPYRCPTQIWTVFQSNRVTSYL